MRYILCIVLFPVCLAVPPAEAREMVAIEGYNPGTIVISTHARKLYYVTSPETAIQYPVGVGRKGKQWTGVTFIAEKRVKPAWSPPESVKRVEPWLPDVIPPGPKNPMGTRALLLDGDEYAIHGTNKPESVGGFVSYGCIRMYNADVEELYNYVQVGTPVIVTH
jgi:lipoprotein-anchoring transpeptidase ErfK/SrfK